MVENERNSLATRFDNFITRRYDELGWSIVVASAGMVGVLAILTVVSLETASQLDIFIFQSEAQGNYVPTILAGLEEKRQLADLYRSYARDAFLLGIATSTVIIPTTIHLMRRAGLIS